MIKRVRSRIVVSSVARLSWLGIDERRYQVRPNITHWTKDDCYRSPCERRNEIATNWVKRP
jgi:hypothetical protein